MIVAIDTSVVLRLLFREPQPLAEWGTWEKAYASELLGVEARRTIDRLRLMQALDDENTARALEQLAQLESAIGRIPLSPPVLRRASLAMPTSVKTLDAIHLASALLLSESRYPELLFATHDLQQSTAARALGFRCIGV